MEREAHSNPTMLRDVAPLPRDGMIVVRSPSVSFISMPGVLFEARERPKSGSAMSEAPKRNDGMYVRRKPP
jgi:hypothetical protein